MKPFRYSNGCNNNWTRRDDRRCSKDLIKDDWCCCPWTKGIFEQQARKKRVFFFSFFVFVAFTTSCLLIMVSAKSAKDTAKRRAFHNGWMGRPTPACHHHHHHHLQHQRRQRWRRQWVSEWVSVWRPLCQVRPESSLSFPGIEQRELTMIDPKDATAEFTTRTRISALVSTSLLVGFGKLPSTSFLRTEIVLSQFPVKREAITRDERTNERTTQMREFTFPR